MMQDGLHIGLAAWINRQRNTGSFPVYPAMPIVTELVNLETVQNVSDLAKAVEFARLVNFVPRQGQVADTFSDSAVLWKVHRDVLNQMDFATQPWTSAEQAAYQTAVGILYTTDASGHPQPSPKLLLYEEMRNAYQDLAQSGGSASEIAQATANWMVLGYKQLIEDAFEIITRLLVQSSRNQAQNEALLLNQDPPGLGLRFYGDTEFAPTHFAPISAIARETWMQAKVSFDDLDRAVGDVQPNGKWKAYRANRTGEVLFDYVVLQCIRPWFTPALYQSDDWKLRTESTVVSKGNGTEGFLPAYVDAVYLVSVRNVTTASKPPKPQLDTPRPRPFPIDRIEILRPELSRLVVRSQPLSVAGLNIGVANKAVNAPITVPTGSTWSGTLDAAQLSNDLVTARLSNVEKPAVDTTRFNAVNLGEVRMLSADNLNSRYTVARGILERVPWRVPAPVEEPTSAQIYVAGFGCTKIPFAPNPNVNYKW